RPPKIRLPLGLLIIPDIATGATGLRISQTRADREGRYVISGTALIRSPMDFQATAVPTMIYRGCHGSAQFADPCRPRRPLRNFRNGSNGGAKLRQSLAATGRLPRAHGRDSEGQRPGTPRENHLKSDNNPRPQPRATPQIPKRPGGPA